MSDTSGRSLKWRGLAVLSLLTAAAAIAACSTDKTTAPAAPPSPIKGQPTVSLYTGDGGDPGPIGTINGFYGAPAANPQLAAYNYCFAQLAAANWNPLYSDQQQRLIWDTTGVNTGGDTLFKARLRIRYAMWAGTYAYGTDPAKELRCIKIDSVWVYRKAATATGYNGGQVSVVDLIDKPSFETAVAGADVWCWGNDLSANPHGPSCTPANAASLKVRAKFPWRRACNFHNDNGFGGFNNGGATADTNQTGGLVGPNYITWSGTPLSWVQQNGYTGDTNQWEVQLWAVESGRWGWWTVNNYGGNLSPYTDGYRAGSPQGKPGSPMCPRYSYDLNNGILYPGGPQSYFNFHGGPTHYAGVGDGSPW
jgi:hypothetical protein